MSFPDLGCFIPGLGVQSITMTLSSRNHAHPFVSWKHCVESKAKLRRSLPEFSTSSKTRPPSRRSCRRWPIAATTCASAWESHCRTTFFGASTFPLHNWSNPPDPRGACLGSRGLEEAGSQNVQESPPSDGNRVWDNMIQLHTGLFLVVASIL